MLWRVNFPRMNNSRLLGMMGLAAKAGKLVPNDERDTKDGGIPSEESDQSEK